MMPKHTPFYNTLNFAVTERMGRLELIRSISALNDVCIEHFFPTHSGAHTELSYKPLSLSVLSGHFFIFIVILAFTCTVFMCELFSVHLAIRKEDDFQTVIDSCVLDIERVCVAFNIRSITITDGNIIGFTCSH
jgi:hypothetical protein